MSPVFALVVAALGVQRLIELRISATHVRALVARGGREHAPSHFAWMRAMHVSWFAGMIAEVVFGRRPFIPALAWPMVGVLLVGQGLRMTAMRTLGARWCVRVVTLPGESPVRRGIYRYIRHPNYLGVILEITAVPLIQTAWVTSVVFTLMNALILVWRIRIEEASLESDNAYCAAFAGVPRLLPLGRRDPPSG